MRMHTSQHSQPRATAETGYYGQPLLKPPVWTWEVPLYFFVGGAGGAAAVIAAVASWEDDTSTLARDARWVAAASGPISAALLTSDLGRPERFVNMLRVFKPQSAMSVGSWTLAAFSTAAGAAAFVAMVERRFDGAVPVRILSRTCSTAAAGLGTIMATYTGVLIGATAIPAWNANVRVLPMHFAASGVGSAAAALELLGHDDAALSRLAFVAAAIETLVGAAIESNGSPAQAPLREGASGWVIRAGGVLSGPAALLCRAFSGRSPRLKRAAAVSALAGSLLTRLGWIAAGSRSAADPRPALRLESAEAVSSRRSW
jgi:DMSO reductase anchor subunit